MCISEYQNSRLQGPMINCYREFYNLQPGQKFLVRMGSCSTSRSSKLLARNPSPDNDPNVQFDGKTLTMSTTFTQWVANPNSDSGTGFVIMPLNNVTAGIYASTLTLTGLEGVGDISIVDGEGSSYANQGDPTDGTFDWSFNIWDEDTDLVVAAAASKSVSLSASFQAIITPSPASTSSSSAANVVQPMFPGIVAGNRALGILFALGAVVGGLAIVL